jgi:hypothetical protein
MRFRFHAGSSSVNDELREFIAARVLAKLSRTRGRIRSIDIYCEDTNGPRGGAGDLIRVIVYLRPAGCVVIRHLDLNPEAGIHAAMQRAIQASRREIGRRRTKRLRNAQRAMHLDQGQPRRDRKLQSLSAHLN